MRSLCTAPCLSGTSREMHVKTLALAVRSPKKPVVGLLGHTTLPCGCSRGLLNVVVSTSRTRMIRSIGLHERRRPQEQ